jgi:hypothetical protein
LGTTGVGKILTSMIGINVLTKSYIRFCLNIRKRDYFRTSHWFSGFCMNSKVGKRFLRERESIDLFSRHHFLNVREVEEIDR